jgi:predicted permease
LIDFKLRLWKTQRVILYDKDTGLSLELKFIIFQSLIIVPFIVGSLMRKIVTDPSAISKRVIGINLTLLEPPVILWSIWGLEIHREFAFLPLAGLAIVITGFLLGTATLPLLGLRGASVKTYLISSSLANHGFTMGGFICYLFLKETGLGLSSIFLIYFMPYTFMIIFTYARMGPGGPTLRSLGEFLRGFQNMPLYAALAALLLQFMEIPRPGIRPPVDLLIMASIILYYWTLGLTFNLKDVLSLRREHLTLAAIKFLAVPGLAFLALRLAGLDRDVATVIQIESFMPAAIYSVVTAILFDLDTRLASSLFVINTLLFIVIVFPVMFLLRGVGLI